jgi:hypothetical protein
MRLTALAKTSLSSSTALVEASSQFGGEAVVENFTDDLYMLQVDVDLNSGTDAEIWVGYRDAHNGRVLYLKSDGSAKVYTYGSGGLSIDWTGTYTTGASVPVRAVMGASNVKYYINGTLKATLSAIQPGGVAFGGDKP